MKILKKSMSAKHDIQGFAYSRSLLKRYGNIIVRGQEYNWQDQYEAWHAVSKIRVRKEAQMLIRSYLLEDVASDLWQLENCFILSYMWSTGEIRDFVLTHDFHILESPKHETWFEAYPFIERDSNNRYTFDISNAEKLIVDKTIAWLPQSFNYTHFLIDFFGPWCEFLPFKYSDLQPHLITRMPWRDWQVSLLKSAEIKKSINIPMKPGQLQLLHIPKLIIPICPSVSKVVAFTRSYLNLYFKKTGEQTKDSVKVVYLKRSKNEQPRVSNCEEISKLVAINGGLTINIAELTYESKFELLGKADFIIAEGSGISNAILFSGEKTKTIVLAAHEMFTADSFLLGGWLYSSLLGSKLNIVKAENSNQLTGQVLGCYEYSVKKIQRILEMECKDGHT